MIEREAFHVYFGGSFDPPHLGHHQILRALLRDEWTQQLHLVPTGRNPLKNSKMLGSEAERREWIEAWLSELRSEETERSEAKLTVEWGELESQKASYTIDTLSALMQRHEIGAKWALAFGADILPELTKWKNVEELLAKLHSVWIFGRGSSESAQEILEQVDAGLRSLCQFRVMGERIRKVSSTELREQCAGGAAPATDDLLPSIRQKLASRGAR